MKNIYIIIISLLFLTSSCTSIKKAEKLYQSFEYSKAAPLYQKIAERDGKYKSHGTERLGDIYRLSSHFEQSVEWYKKAIAIGDVKNETFINYGQVLRSLGRYEEALAQFEKYMQLEPSDVKAKKYAEYCREVLQNKEAVEFFEIVNLKGINTQYSDFSPFISSNKLVFTSDRKSSTGSNRYGWTGAYYLDLYETSIPEFANPGKENNCDIMSKTINIAYHDGPASFSKDGKSMFFTRVYKNLGSLDTSRFYTNKLKIFTSFLDGDNWSEPEPFYLNNDNYSVGHPVISQEGNTLYFVSDMPGGKGGTDIYSVTNINGKWENLVNLGDVINTFGNEMFPYIDEGGVLYFSSNGMPGLGSLDIFKSTYINGKWTEPENLKEPINSSADDFGFYRNTNGNILFSSNRPGGEGSDDIYMASVIKYADSVLVSGLVKDRTNGENLVNATVTLWDVTTDDVLVLKTNSLGEYSRILKPGHIYIFKSVVKGYSTDCLTLSIPQYTREVNHKNRDLLLVKLKVNEIFKLENVYYDFDKYNIRPDAAIELDKLISFLIQNPGVNVELGSHTDSRGKTLYNEWLAEFRANSAVKYIHDKGIRENRITAKGYGETQLVNKCANGVRCSEQDHQANRRTEIKITGLTYDGETEDFGLFESLNNGQVIKKSLLNESFFSNCGEEEKGI